MKLKTVYYTVALIFVVVGVALWKLNETYRAEKIAVKQNQLQTQLTALRSSLVSQISQLRNTLSAYTGQVDESKINWVQLKPFYALAIVQEDGSNRLTISQLFLQSGSVAERWNSTTLQQNLTARISGNQLLRAQTFKDASGLPHLALAIFDREKRNGLPRSGVLVVGDVSYFQRFFDLQRTSSITQVLLTTDKQVTAHSEYEYVGNTSDENKISETNFFVDRQEIRGTNLTLLSYSSKKAQTNLDIPVSMLGTIIGLAFLMSGVLLFAVKPEKEQTDIAAASGQMQNSQSQSFQPQPMQTVKSAKPKKSGDAEEESAGLGFTLSAPTPNPLTLIKNVKPNFIPLSFDQEPQVVPIQVQASLQQALFNVDRQLKANGVSVVKEFVSIQSIELDYPKFIKIFENILLTVSQSLTGDKKRMQLRSYDSDDQTVLEIQAPSASLSLHELIIPALIEAHCEYTQAISSAGEAIFRFTFTHPEESEKDSASTTFDISQMIQPTASTEKRFELTEDDTEDFKMPDTLKSTQSTKPVIHDDLDIDALLSLDDEPAAQKTAAPSSSTDSETIEITQTHSGMTKTGVSKTKINIEKEMQPSKFKLDDKMSIVEDPAINIETAENNKADKTKVKIRRPEKG